MTMMGKKTVRNLIIISVVLVGVLGVILLGRGLALSGGSAAAKASNAAAQTSSIDASGVQNITTTMKSSSSYPVITVKAGVPVVWTFKADKSVLNGCNSSIVIPDYNIQLKLKAGDNIIKFTPTTAGTQQYSCWMGMVYGQIKVVNADGSSAANAGSGDSSSALPNNPAGKGSCCAAAPGTGNTAAFTGTKAAGGGSCCGTGTPVISQSASFAAR